MSVSLCLHGILGWEYGKETVRPRGSAAVGTIAPPERDIEGLYTNFVDTVYRAY